MANRTPEQQAKLDEMDAAGQVAGDDLTAQLESMTAAERKGADAVINWVAKNVPTAGYKRLGRFIRNLAEG